MTFRYANHPEQSLLKKLLSPAFLARKLKRVAHNLYWDLRFGGLCGGSVPALAHSGANKTHSAEYDQLAILFRPDRTPIAPSDVLIDVGCGKGRVLNYWLRSGLRNRMVGIELNEEVARWTRRRLRPYTNVEIIAGDAVRNIPTDSTIIFLFDPFHGRVMEQFKSRLAELFGARGNVTIVYYYCACLELYENDPLWAVDLLASDHSLAYPSAVIRMKGPAPEKGEGEKGGSGVDGPDLRLGK